MGFLKTFFILCLNFCLIFGHEVPEKIEVEINQGKLTGISELSRDGRKFFAFRGIPYATASKRFSNSIPASNWSDTLDASKYGEACVQFSCIAYKVEGQDDCLTINIASPNLKPEKKMPVIVNIDGAMFFFNKPSDNGPAYFMDEDVILITFNYRLGPFGFLNLGIPGAEGNQGLRDQVLALKWVRENIENFGGDKDKVTLMGSFGGAASIHLLMLSPMAKGLFQNAISQSGSGLSSWSFTEDPIWEAKKLGQMLDCPTNNVNHLYECFMKLDPKYLLERSSTLDMVNIMGWNPKVPTAWFGPSIDKSDNSENESFLPDKPCNLLKNGNYNKVPLIAGGNKLEGACMGNSLLANETLKNMINNQWGRVMPITLQFDNTQCDTCKISSKIRKFYLNDEDGKVEEKNSEDFVNIFTDSSYLYPIKTFAKMHAKNSPAYLYYFTHKGESSIIDEIFSDLKGREGLKDPINGDEKLYLFEMDHLLPNQIKNERFVNFSKKMIKFFVSFANNGKPSESSWKQYNPNEKEEKWTVIDEEFTLEDERNILGERMSFWDGLMKEIYKIEK